MLQGERVRGASFVSYRHIFLVLFPRDDSQGSFRFDPICPPVCLSVRHTYSEEFVLAIPPTVLVIIFRLHTCCGLVVS